MKFYIFDIDGTLCNRDSSELLPSVAEWRKQNPDVDVAFATNQGGVGLQEWMLYKGFGDPYKYPSHDQVMERLHNVATAFNVPFNQIYVCFAYQTERGRWAEFPPTKMYKRPEWSQEWRKPSPGMLLQAMTDTGVGPADTLFVGDSEEDRQAAQAAGVEFVEAKEFFNAIPKP